jgi:biotin carboxyl carrier protein
MAKYQYKVKGVDYEVEIQNVDGNLATVTVNGTPIEVEMTHPIKNHETNKHVTVKAPMPVAPAPVAAPAVTQEVETSTSGSKVMSPLPGTITEIKVNVGDSVKEGDVVIVLEAMKMQNNIESDYSGTVTSILVNKGDAVMEGAALLTIG